MDEVRLKQFRSTEKYILKLNAQIFEKLMRRNLLALKKFFLCDLLRIVVDEQ